ncbi:MAG: AI-2E family transporter [Chloroflexia bacterium]
MNNNRWLQALIILLVVIAASWLASQLWLLIIQFAGIILLFFLAWLLAFALSPMARRLQAAGLAQPPAVTIVYLAMLLVLALTGLLLFPILAVQIQTLINNTPGYTTQLENLSIQMQDQLQTWGVRVQDINFSSLYGTLGEQVKNVGGSVLNFVTGLAAFLFNAIIVLLLSFYFMKDGTRMFNNAVAILPPTLAEEVELMGTSIGRAFGGFLRGQLLFALLYGIINAIIMQLFGLDYVLIASIVAGLLMVIPLLGGFLAYVPPLLVALVTPSAAGNWWLLLLVLFVVQTLMVQVVSPRIMGQAVGMHPLFVIAALLIGLQLAGPWGALFGIPVAGVLYQVAGPYTARLRGFFDVPTPEEPALALEGTTPAAVVALPEAQLMSAVPTPTPLVADVRRTRTRIPTPQASVGMLVRGLGRRVQAVRRRSRP